MFERLVSAFVAPADGRTERSPAGPPRRRGSQTADPRSSPPVPSAASVAVLVAPGDARAVGGAVALGLAAGAAGGAAGGGAVVAMWGAAPGLAVPASLAARRTAARLSERGHAATPSGRLVIVALDAPHEAVRAAAATGIATVLVVAGPRDDATDRLLAGQDHVIVAGPGSLGDLAAASVRALGVCAATLALPDAPVASALAAGGVALVEPWRSAVREALP